MNILIIGASGYVGRYLSDFLLENKHHVTVSSRNVAFSSKLLGKRMEYVEWDGKDASMLAPALENMDAVINLAGVSLASGRWTPGKKKKFFESRVNTGEAVTEAFRISGNWPQVLIQASASGIYGPDANVAAGERRQTGQGYLADLCILWENSVKPLEDLGVRVAYLRTGPILGPHSPFLKNLLLPFRFGMGLILGSGNQWLSWIHILDVIGAIRFLLENPNTKGPFNLTAPEPVTLSQFTKTIAKIRRQPAWVYVPSFLLKLILGEMADETILASQDVLPEALLDAGYAFRFPDIDLALLDLLKKK